MLNKKQLDAKHNKETAKHIDNLNFIKKCYIKKNNSGEALNNSACRPDRVEQF